jgi:hypothetical protein
MQHGVQVTPLPKARSAESHLEGLGTVVMLEMRKRIIQRLEETDTRFMWFFTYLSNGKNLVRHIVQGIDPIFALDDDDEEEQTARDRAEFADWMIRRMAENRLRDGKQMDSILEASYKAFLPELMAQAIRTVK